MREIVVLLHDIRSTHNVGSLFRTADGIGVKELIISGYTPYPHYKNDERLPHISRKLTDQIHKTALGAEGSVRWRLSPSILDSITSLRAEGYFVVALEQTDKAKQLPDFTVPEKTALLIGREVEGIEQHLLDVVDDHLVIPMFGQKESFNVVQASAMALYHFRFS